MDDTGGADNWKTSQLRRLPRQAIDRAFPSRSCGAPLWRSDPVIGRRRRIASLADRAPAPARHAGIDHRQRTLATRDALPGGFGAAAA